MQLFSGANFGAQLLGAQMFLGSANGNVGSAYENVGSAYGNVGSAYGDVGSNDEGFMGATG